MFIFSSAKTESGSSYDNADAVSGTSNEYEMTSSNKDEFSSADAYEYDDIDELRAGYAELQSVKAQQQAISTIRYDTIAEFNVDWKAEYSALSSTRSQKKKLKQPTPVPL